MPSKEMLDGVDVLVYDIQDIGCRSFTYISTLGNIMKAAAEYGKQVVVLDRPNPLGGLKVEGNLTEDDCVSFVSQFKIPYVYGLTSGELALMLNGENMLGKKCDLTVVKMKGWKRSMTYEDTGLQWVLSSPHIPEAITAPFYSVSGIAGELDSLSIGVGYTLPFRLFGASWIKAHELAADLNSLGLEGVTFRPSTTHRSTDRKGRELQEYRCISQITKKAALTDIQLRASGTLTSSIPITTCLPRRATTAT